jgi:hypothetical protein
LSVGVGLRVVHELMEAEVDEVVGPKGKWDPQRAASGHGHEAGSMTLGRAACAGQPSAGAVGRWRKELSIATYEYFADRDPLQWGGDGPDARRGVDAEVRPGRGARRQEASIINVMV